MTEQTVIIKVELNTAPAKKEVDGLVQHAAMAGRRIGGFVGGTLGTGLRMMGLGGGIALATHALRGPTESGFADTVGEAFGGIGKSVEKFFLGDLPQEARAAQRAREETIAAAGASIGARGSVSPGDRAFFTQVQALRLTEEKGRAIVEREFRGVDMKELIEQATSNLGKILSDTVTQMSNATQWGG